MQLIVTSDGNSQSNSTAFGVRSKFRKTIHPAQHPTQTKFCSDPNCISPECGLLKKTPVATSVITGARAAKNQAKNNVTSRVRLDEKYAERRALIKLANQEPNFARVCGVFFAKEMPGSSPAARCAHQCKRPTKPARTPSLAATPRCARQAKPPTPGEAKKTIYPAKQERSTHRYTCKSSSQFLNKQAKALQQSHTKADNEQRKVIFKTSCRNEIQDKNTAFRPYILLKQL